MTHTPTEMEMRVAKALAGNDWEFLPKRDQRAAICNARAAIRAMREPTDAMCVAGWEELPAGGFQAPAMQYPWRAMIDAASPPNTETK